MSRSMRPSSLKSARRFQAGKARTIARRMTLHLTYNGTRYHGLRMPQPWWRAGSADVVRRRRHAEELLERVPGAGVIFRGELRADVAQMPGFRRVAGDVGAAVFVADDPPELPRMRRHPRLLRGAGEALEPDAAARAGGDVGGESGLVLAVAGPCADGVGVRPPVGRHLS